MKKRTHVIMILIIAMFSGSHAEANIWRVNNNANATNGSNFGGTISIPVFQQLIGTGPTSANGSNLVVDGDTVHLEGSTVNYLGGSLAKRLVIIGPGYFLNENSNTSNNMLPAVIGHIIFAAGSSGSQLIGLHVRDDANEVKMDVSDILVKRCKIDRAVHLSPGTSDIRILQNFFSKTTVSAIETEGGGFPTDVIFNNNIVLGTLVLQSNYTMLECKNNVFAGLATGGNPTLLLYAGSFQNNIMTNPGATTNINGGTNLNVTYNTGSSASQFGGGTGNIVIANMAASLFVATGTSDGKYQLQPGSATGSDGATERGAFGGSAITSRYSLSGLAPIPVIYEINTSGVATPSGLDVNIKAKTIK